MRIVEVGWNDAWSEDNDDLIEETIADMHGPLFQLSVGYEVVNDDKGVSLAETRDEDGGFHHVTFIPAGMILSITALKRV